MNLLFLTGGNLQAKRQYKTECVHLQGCICSGCRDVGYALLSMEAEVSVLAPHRNLTPLVLRPVAGNSEWIRIIVDHSAADGIGWRHPTF